VHPRADRDLKPFTRAADPDIGHLRVISNIVGLQVLVDDVLPRLTGELGADCYEVHVVGDYEPPEPLRAALDRPAVRLRGRIEPPDGEFLGADVVVLPTPVRTRPRVRILTACSLGCCVVARSANRLEVQALTHGENVLLGAAGQRLYESRFTPENAGGRIVEELERIARLAADGAAR